MIKKLLELAKEEKVLLDCCIGPANAITIKVFANHQDFVTIHNPSSFSDDEIIEITKDVIRRAKND